MASKLGKQDGWARRLAVPLRLRDGRELVTLEDARGFLLELEEAANSPHWHGAGVSLIEAAAAGERDAPAAIVKATERIGMALFIAAKLRL